MHRPQTLAIAVLAIVLAGCTDTRVITEDNPRGVVEYRLRLAEFSEYDGAVSTSPDGLAEDPKWSAQVSREATPERANPADYGANEKGEYWQDTIIEAKTYHLAEGAALTTHTHGIVIIATESITIDGRINVHGLGAQPNEAGYSSSRANTLALYRAYGEADEATGEPLLWGAGGPDCNGGGYVILHAPEIVLNGEVDAGSDCGQGGIVYLEGNTTGTGAVSASLVIHRGAA